MTASINAIFFIKKQHAVNLPGALLYFKYPLPLKNTNGNPFFFDELNLNINLHYSLACLKLYY